MIQPGTYRARAIAADIRFGVAGTGSEQIAVPFTLIDERLSGQTITWIGSFASDKAIEITLKGLRATGWSSDELTDLAGVGSVDSDLVVEHEADRDSGQMRVRVRWVNPAGGGRFKFKQELDRGSLSDLASRIKGHAVASREGQPSRSAALGAAPAGRRPTPVGRNGKAGDWDGQGADPGADDLPF